MTLRHSHQPKRAKVSHGKKAHKPKKPKKTAVHATSTHQPRFGLDLRR